VNRHATFIGAPDCFRLGLHHYRIEADLLGAPTRWDTGFFPPKRGTVVWRWLNTGQSGLYVNNTLVAFRNDVSPGQTLQLDRVYVGGFLPTAVSPHGWMHYLRLNVTRTNDASVAVGYHLDLDKDDLAELHECFSASQMRSLQATVMNFMRQFIQTATQDWQLSPGGKGTSSAPAVMAHELAMELTALLVPRLKRDQGTDELIVEKWDRFLSLLRDAQPQDFCNELKALQKILGAEDPECKRKRAQLVKKYGAHYEKLDGLFARLGGLLVEKCEGESH
jgi:hypothetical protein